MALSTIEILELEQTIKKEIKKYFHAVKYGMKNERKIRFAEGIKNMATDYEGCDKWVLKFKYGYTEVNNFGKKIRFIFGY